MDITQSKGDFVELQCIAAFIKMGYECSVPYGNSARYDFIVDYNGELLKIQCKSSHYPRNNGKFDYGAFMFSTTTQTTNTKKTTRHKYDSEQIDYFATFFNGNVYIVPVEECSTVKTLRLTPPNNNNSNYNKAEDYLIEKRFKPYFEEEILQESTEIFYCVKCNNNQVYNKGGICHECASFLQRKVERPSRGELKDMIRTQSFLSIAAKYNVSDAAIRKWCKSENLPTKKGEIKNITEEDWEKI